MLLMVHPGYPYKQIPCTSPTDIAAALHMLRNLASKREGRHGGVASEDPCPTERPSMCKPHTHFRAPVEHTKSSRALYRVMHTNQVRNVFSQSKAVTDRTSTETGVKVESIECSPLSRSGTMPDLAASIIARWGCYDRKTHTRDGNRGVSLYVCA